MSALSRRGCYPIRNHEARMKSLRQNRGTGMGGYGSALLPGVTRDRIGSTVAK